jgi:ABC-type antimicrobial peptide transport system permease subunit
MRISLRGGRGVLPTDDSRSVKVALVDELLARRFFGSRDPIGRRISFGPGDTLQIIGLVASVKEGGLAAEDLPTVYIPIAQSPESFADLEIRTAADPAHFASIVKRAIAEVDPTVGVSDIEPLSVRMADSVGTTRFATVLASLFAVVALVLGAIGVYSVLAYIVGQRQREIAVRLALGADRARVMSDVLLEALALAGAGIASGSVVAWVAARTLAGLFMGVNPHDPLILVGAPIVFTAVALIAASIPAWRTTRIRPAAALAVG